MEPFLQLTTQSGIEIFKNILYQSNKMKKHFVCATIKSLNDRTITNSYKKNNTLID